ncbi:fumarylacetoacetate hydrolase family protein [Arthrobacter crystallopoietes]|uniref:Fumarylacetoacetate (FAA) hydrolase family protein n=1 Tax=Crystallibacter crystallopoietes TaxID=37928 RepID=A0A1H0ZLW0_9MICC|nr:fumarylacetoacetate hydrolase family protein [Arthrobacter crystallopoietes]AUI51927.1 fumarylacetoacetate hydrolase [Arthrobacter crystallopoietes]SDQ28066.1 Fumarylacetoacetate (FAA) hydrolase family protein [Arthrobacter crystallopoietes]
MTAFPAREILPSDADEALLIGRVWDPESGGPRVVVAKGEDVYDITAVARTVADLLEQDDPAQHAAAALDRPRWTLAELVDASWNADAGSAHLLAPIDLQVVKACGVTFVESMVERVIEERCGGDFNKAAEVRELVGKALGGSISSLRPGSEAAMQAKRVLIAEGMWSQYLEVGIGPDPEVFTKAPVLSAVGFGADVGIPTFSSWNNPEPELVLVADSSGTVRGATLGNDVNLRDVEGRSALLLGKAKDNNASTALGPFIRLFDGDFTLDTLREEEITLKVQGQDGYALEGRNNVAKISRPFEELVRAAHGSHHQYPDGFVLFTGTLFAPTQDRDTPGQGFTHKPGDTVTIRSKHLGTLANRTGITEELPPWTFGIRQLFAYLQSPAVVGTPQHVGRNA